MMPPEQKRTMHKQWKKNPKSTQAGLDWFFGNRAQCP